jgi:hypothetical protein
VKERYRKRVLAAAAPPRSEELSKHGTALSYGGCLTQRLGRVLQRTLDRRRVTSVAHAGTWLSGPFGQSGRRPISLEQLLYEGELFLELSQPDLRLGKRLTRALELLHRGDGRAGVSL